METPSITYMHLLLPGTIASNSAMTFEEEAARVPYESRFPRLRISPLISLRSEVLALLSQRRWASSGSVSVPVPRGETRGSRPREFRRFSTGLTVESGHHEYRSIDP